MNSQQGWRKSSYSVNTTTCIELSASLGRIRDSKEPEGPTLKADLAGFLRAVKAGRFDR